MTTIVNTPAPTTDNGGGTGLIIGIFVLVVLGLVFFYFGLPAIRQMGSVQPQVNIPSKIDVNVNQTP